MTVAIGQTPQPTSADTFEIVLLVCVMIAALLVLTVAILLIRKHTLRPDPPSVVPGSFLEELRRMRDSGAISPIEYDMARRSLAAKIRADRAEKDS